ncbi:MAG: putative selenate reductase subunit YgfK [Bacillota bacterium]|nr:putative selenate reductase subunit YgfK [Bacillota bacterium]
MTNRTDLMQPPSFAELLRWLRGEYQRRGTVFGVKPVPQSARHIRLYDTPGQGSPHGTKRSDCRVGFGHDAVYGQSLVQLDNVIGPAAGPHSQLAPNIIAAYAAGARFFELKTVQVLDGEDLPVAKPCISAADEGYNVEWSTELTVEQALEEYIKAWFALKLISREWQLGDTDGFAFNISVGYDLDGIRSPKVDGFIEAMKNAAATPVWQECRAQALALSWRRLDADYIEAVSPRVCSSVTLSTLHGCPPEEIERIAAYLLGEKGLNTYIKCNPTLLGYDFVRRRCAELGYGYLRFDDHHFREDLQFADALALIARLRALAAELGRQFGLKLSNTLPVQNDGRTLSGDEMYMSGRALFPLTVELAARLHHATAGGALPELPISFCGGADAHNIAALAACGVKPVTVATTLLKPGGYQRLSQLAELLDGVSLPSAIDGAALSALAAADDGYYRQPPRREPAAALPGAPPLLDCFAAPCVQGCPIRQQIPAYLRALAAGDTPAALRIISERDPLPHLTAALCPHRCTLSCNRRFYERAVDIRGCKLAATAAAAAILPELSSPAYNGRKAAVIGGGPAGMAAAILLAREGWQVTLFEQSGSLGGLVRHTIPDFRISGAAIDADAAQLTALGVELRLHTRIDDLQQLAGGGYQLLILAVGAAKHGQLRLAGGPALNAVDFLTRLKSGETMRLGKHVAVIGGGNSAFDAARAARRLPGVDSVTVVYRRDVEQMPAALEELRQALDEGVRFLPLCSPSALADGLLHCEKTRLGAADASGRAAFSASGETLALPCDSVIAAVGEQIDGEAYRRLGIVCDERGYPLLDGDNRAVWDAAHQQLPPLYVIGDGARGPATIVEAIADAHRALGHDLSARGSNAAHTGQAPRGYLAPPLPQDEARCLDCDTLCAQCVESCPNRANLLIEGAGGRQILHLDALCNECGNCAAFCPYEGAPYRDKLTLFADRAAFNASENYGFLPLGGGEYLRRLPEHTDIQALLHDIEQFYPYILPE